jgi:hypothetical protein
MKKIIKGKQYDTDKARYLGGDNGGESSSRWSEELYQKRTGEFFLYGEGGPMTRYAVATDENNWKGGAEIMPLTFETARQWAEEHLNADQYAGIFGTPDEDAGKADLNIQLDAVLMAKLRARAAEDGTSLTATVAALLEKGLEK